MNKFDKLYNIIMEELLQNKSGAAIKIKESDSEYNEVNVEINSVLNKIIDMLRDEFKSDLAANEKIELITKGKHYIIKCPRKIREQIMQKTPFLTQGISNAINNGQLIDKNYIFKISEPEEKKSFEQIDNDTEDIKYIKSSKSSAGEYNIPIIIQSEDNDDDYYQFGITLYAKPNSGATEHRENNLSITLCEFTPCLLWNLKIGKDITLDDVINAIRNFDVNNSEYTDEKSKNKITKLVEYFNNTKEYNKLIINKLYGVIRYL